MLLTSRKIPLAVPPWGDEEINEAIDSLHSGMLTMGKKVKRCEQLWADYIGVHHGIMTNSGSSANLIALSSLRMAGLLKPGDEIITPALTWATTVFPIAQVGCLPVLVDVEQDTYNIEPEAVKEAITDKTRGIMPVHLLGNPCDMDQLLSISSEYGLQLIEDACEAHGATWRGKMVGSFGDLATFSFFFSHHLTTIEGGMIMSPGSKLAEICRSLRAFGWARELLDKENITKEYPEIDPRFLFLYPGFNVRPTEIQGAFGIHQVPRLEGLISHRRENAAYWNKELGAYKDWLGLPQERPYARHAYFAYAITVKPSAPFSRRELQGYLESNGVETRPIEAGNMAIQPAMKHIPHRVEGTLANTQYIHDNAFFFGNHQGIGSEEREAIVGYFDDFIRRYK